MAIVQRIAGSLHRSRTALNTPPVRTASEWASARWSNLVRAQSKVTAIDDPPMAPLHEEHEVNGKADFSNFVDRNADVSKNQAVFSLGLMLGFFVVVYRYTSKKAKSSEPRFTLREFPDIEKSLPNYQGKKY
jgi:hypothetical protein